MSPTNVSDRSRSYAYIPQLSATTPQNTFGFLPLLQQPGLQLIVRIIVRCLPWLGAQLRRGKVPGNIGLEASQVTACLKHFLSATKLPGIRRHGMINIGFLLEGVHIGSW